MGMKFGVVVDEGGFVWATIQWDEKARQPNFNAPGLPLTYILTSPEALAIEDYKQRWDFNAKTWVNPTERYWLVDKRGDVIGGTTYWPERMPTAKPGFEVVTTPRPAKGPSKAGAVWDSEAQEWKENRRVAMIDEDGVVENMVLENPRSDTENVELPEGWEREDDDGDGLPLDIDGEPIRRGSMKDEDGTFKFVNFTVTKARINTFLANQNVEVEWQAYLELKGGGLWDNWLASPDDREFNLADRQKLIINFLKSLGFTRTQIINRIRTQIKE